MFKYGIYLLNNGNLFKDHLVAVEGIVRIPNCKIIAVWGELKYQDEVIFEIVTYDKDEFDPVYADHLVSKIIQRIKNRIKLINRLKSNKKNIPITNETEFDFLKRENIRSFLKKSETEEQDLNPMNYKNIKKFISKKEEQQENQEVKSQKNGSGWTLTVTILILIFLALIV